MPRLRTGHPVGRPVTYATEDEKPVTVSLRIPRDVYKQAKRYVAMRLPMTLTDLLLDGLRLRLDTPTDPRDILLSDDNTVIQELQEMIQAAVKTEIGKLSDFMGHVGTLGLLPAPEAPGPLIPDISYDKNTVIQQLGVSDVEVPGQTDSSAILAQPSSEILYSSNAVIHQPEALEPVADMPADAPGYDRSKYVLGKLCQGNHDYNSTGHTLLTLKGRKCPQCQTAQQRQRREAKRQGVPAI